MWISVVQILECVYVCLLSELRLRKLSLRAKSEDIATEKAEYVQGMENAGVTFGDDSPIGRIVQVAKPENQEEEYSPGDQFTTFELLDKLDVKVMITH